VVERIVLITGVFRQDLMEDHFFQKEGVTDVAKFFKPPALSDARTACFFEGFGREFGPSSYQPFSFSS